LISAIVDPRQVRNLPIRGVRGTYAAWAQSAIDWIDPFKPALPRKCLISGGSTMPETIAEVCQWRLRAEAVRTEADGFSSPSAKQAMHYVAETWDLMAENLERRLSKTPDDSSPLFTRRV
jgi:hypothetical protein